MTRGVSEAAAGLSLVGAGSLGQAFAGLLAAAGRPVTLLATPTTAARLLEAGCLRLRGAVTLDVATSAVAGAAGVAHVTADPARLPTGAGLLFVTKGHQLREAIRTVRPAWPTAGDERAWVGGLQNGLVKDDLLAAAFGPARVVGAVTILGAERRPDGEVQVTSLGRTFLGELDGSRSPRVAAAVEALTTAGIPAEAPADIRSVLWSKACNAAGVFGVSVLTRSSAPRLFGSPDLIRAYLPLVRETAALAAAHGVPVGDYTHFPIRTYVSRPDEETVAALAGKGFLAPPAGKGPETFPSMTQDFVAGRALEVDEVFGDLVERADRAGVAVPRLRLVRDLLRGLDPGRQPR